MKHDLSGRPRLALTAAVVVALGVGVTIGALVVGANDDRDGDGGPPVRHGISLVSFDTCDAALAEMKSRVLPRVGPYGLDEGTFVEMEDGDLPAAGGRAEAPAAPGAAPAEDSAASKQAAPEHSTTNVHEQGVDEPDLVKTDGRRVVSVADGVVRVVDVASRAQTAAVSLEGGHPTQLLLAGDRALVMSGGDAIAYDTPGIAPGEPAPRRTPKPAPTDTFQYASTLTLVDLTGTGRVLGTLSLDGSYLDARQVGAVARVVVRSVPRLEFTYPGEEAGPAHAMLANKDVVANSTIADWLPAYRLETGTGATTGQLTDCADVSHPVDYSATAMLTVLTFDLTKDLGTGDPVTIVADGDTVYGTGANLYVADDHVAHAMGGTRADGGRTELYQFDISGAGKPVHVASGGVDGTLLNQYSLSEHDGDLRVATTTSDRSGSQSRITVLRRDGNTLDRVGLVDGLGVGERIYAVRYFGDTAYVVTFRQTDPLYTVDLSDPAAPKVTGELKITGYSAYLHPAGEGRLIGVGQEADTSGRVTGAQISLFDTTKPGATRLAQYHLEDSWTEVEGDPHAFLYWPDKGLLVVPVSGGVAVTGGEPERMTAGALVLKVDGNSFRQTGMLTHTSDRYDGVPMAPRRAMVIGDELWTVSEAGVLVSDLDSLGQLAWVAFT
ncbi:beta-propeller domain-containing protein [Actinophytocola glycyrrhizae]|uniref:Beta-propeller domain-containing protein n=1 Tax=Actinophytocola glycyrrhizae TaxID=2044873 RepID=A0ABV9SBB3_9PSEU